MEQPEKIFISYAWESEQFKIEVLNFARWLAHQLDLRGQKNYVVIMDYLHSITPPEKGWLTWMSDEIQQAQTVLVICTPKYLSAFDKVDDGIAGKGGSYEGSIINQILYNNYQRNRKFFPILPNEGDPKNIPLTLLPWWNGMRFHLNNEEIFRLILRQNPTLLSSTDPSIEKAVVQEIVESVKKENIIIEEIVDSIDNKSKPMLKPTQLLVRAFVTLSSLEKIQVAKKIGIYDSKFQNLSPNDIDREIFKQVKDKNLVHKLWDELTLLKRLDSQTNPFTS